MKYKSIIHFSFDSHIDYKTSAHKDEQNEIYTIKLKNLDTDFT